MKERIEPIALEPSASIVSAMEAMEEGKSAGAPAGIVIITEPDSERILGVVTDGDLRRAIIDNIELGSPLSDIMSTNPLVISDATNATQMLKQLHGGLEDRNDPETKYHHIVVVDDKNHVLDVVTPFELWKRSEVRINSATVVGLGFVGLTFSLVLAESDITVTGIDMDKSIRENLRSGTPHFHEQGIEPLLNKHIGDNFTVAEDISDVDNDIFVLCVNTPVNENREIETTYLQEAAAEVGSNLAVHDLVIVRSTVAMGTTRNIVIPELEAASGLTVGEDFFVAYAPERTVAGNALNELRELPQVIGGVTNTSVDYASKLFHTFTNSTISVSTLESAEAVKLLSNAYRDLRFAFANETARLCNGWGIDTQEVIQAANDGYERNQIPKPSPGVGGACLTKDPYLLAQSGTAVDYQTRLPSVSRTINQEMPGFVAEKIASFTAQSSASPETKVFLMGMAFKGQPETSDMRNSPGVEICQHLQDAVDIRAVYDPVVPKGQLQEIGDEVVSMPNSGFTDADCVAILTNHPSFMKLDLREMGEETNDPFFLFDPWSMINEEEVQTLPGVHYNRFSGVDLVSDPGNE